MRFEKISVTHILKNILKHISIVKSGYSRNIISNERLLEISWTRNQTV